MLGKKLENNGPLLNAGCPILILSLPPYDMPVLLSGQNSVAYSHIHKYTHILGSYSVGNEVKEQPNPCHCQSMVTRTLFLLTC